MSGIKQKIKNILPGAAEKETGLGTTTNTGTGYGTTTTGQYETPTTGAAGYGMVGGEREREGAYETTTTAGEAATCGRESFTKVEDRPRVIEQKVLLNLIYNMFFLFHIFYYYHILLYYFPKPPFCQNRRVAVFSLLPSPFSCLL
jgi:hypothetical protein